ncbi:hypothetical protein MRB53_010496 [Persea americana]|uniref:Uncharacterized protein n=1 Tax=Persea americana TaxID=3435 RepID=A0ACC2LS31_PERAE|nr:hypothetical protein MRB53_010496 [Persea americana]
MNTVLSVSKLSEGMVVPCEVTPSGTLGLSLIDALPALRDKVRSLNVFRHGPNAATVIREALSKALVHYYPLAGRLVEAPLLQLACTAEGVWFVEASAQCNLEAIDYLDNEILEWRLQLLPQPPPEKDGFDPLVLMQVTQFTCGGFVMGLQFSHCVCDGMGAAQFLKAVGEFARGIQFPTIPPAWCREALPPPPLAHAAIPPPLPDVEDRHISLGHANIDISPDLIARLKLQFLELTGKPCSTFEALAAKVWRCRAQAITYNNFAAPATAADNNNNNKINGGDATLAFFSNARRLVDPPLPQGFYGNCVFPVAVSLPLAKLRCATQVEIVKLIQEAKAKLPAQVTQWMAMTKRNDHDHYDDDDDDTDDGYVDPFAPLPLLCDKLFVAEWGRLGFGDVDYGWGPPIHMAPVNYSSTIPVCIMGSPPSPRKGVRLMTWCVEDSHLSTFRKLLMDQPLKELAV